MSYNIADYVDSVSAAAGWRAVFRKGEVFDQFPVVCFDRYATEESFDLVGVVLVRKTFQRASDVPGFVGYIAPGEGLTRLKNELKNEDKQ